MLANIPAPWIIWVPRAQKTESLLSIEESWGYPVFRSNRRAVPVLVSMFPQPGAPTQFGDSRGEDCKELKDGAFPSNEGFLT